MKILGAVEHEPGHVIHLGVQAGDHGGDVGGGVGVADRHDGPSIACIGLRVIPEQVEPFGGLVVFGGFQLLPQLAGGQNP